MLSRVHAFLLRQLGENISSVRTVDDGPHELTIEATDHAGATYVAKAAPTPRIAVEVDALLAADALGVPHGALSGYELGGGDDSDTSLILTRRLAGVSLARLAPATPSNAVVAMIVDALATIHSRVVCGWGPLDWGASQQTRAPVGSFETWLASATYGVEEALERVEAARVLQPDLSAALRAAVALTPPEPCGGSRWLHGNLSPSQIVVSADGARFAGFDGFGETECGDPDRDLGRWVLRDGARRLATVLDAYGAVAGTSTDPWRVWWWALLDAVHLLDRSIAHGALTLQLDLPVRIVELLDEAGLKERPTHARRS